jgi:hypothetical protein
VFCGDLRESGEKAKLGIAHENSKKKAQISDKRIGIGAKNCENRVMSKHFNSL